MNEDSAGRVVNLSGIGSGSSNEFQRLTVTADSSNPGLIPTPYVNYISPNSVGALIFGPRPNANGSAAIKLTVNDGETVLSRTFVVTILSVNDVPKLSFIPNQRILQDTSTAPLPIAIGDVETPADNLVLAASSSNPALVPLSSIILGGMGSNRTVQVTPLPGRTGSAMITVSVHDGTTNVGSAFQLTVLPSVEIKILAAAPVLSSGFALRWQSLPGRTYRVCFKDTFEETHWTDLTSDIVAMSLSTSWTDLTFNRRKSRFYKVRLVYGGD
jgi:hypothetical protein